MQLVPGIDEMKLTNKNGLPDILVRAIENDPYDAGDSDITTTQLITPPQIVALKKRYADKIEIEASSRFWSLLGKAAHSMIERQSQNEIVEKRFFQDVLGWKVSGQVDLIDGKELTDWKVTSVWTYIYGSRMKEWEQQANINRWLASKNGVQVEHLTNYLILRDWVESKAGTGDYPALPIVSVGFPLWPVDQAEWFLEKWVQRHQAAQELSDRQLANAFPCSDEDRWWNEKKKMFIRCEKYCEVASVCVQKNG